MLGIGGGIAYNAGLSQLSSFGCDASAIGGCGIRTGAEGNDCPRADGAEGFAGNGADFGCGKCSSRSAAAGHEDGGFDL